MRAWVFTSDAVWHDMQALIKTELLNCVKDEKEQTISKKVHRAKQPCSRESCLALCPAKSMIMALYESPLGWQSMRPIRAPNLQWTSRQ